MKSLKEILVSILVILTIGSIIVLTVQNYRNRNNRELAKRMAELSPRGGPPETIDGLRQAIAIYEDQIERNVREGAQAGVYWKILATRLADRGMHKDALAALEKAINYNAADPVLFYLTGISAGVTAKSVVGFSSASDRERTQYFTLSENAYKRAIELDGTYTRAMYGLGVLYSFELDRPQDAIPYMLRFLEMQPSDVPGMFVLARVYYMTGNSTGAIELYERIISRTRDNKIKAEAQNNIETIRGLSYE